MAEIVENCLILNGYLYYHSRDVGANRQHWVCRRERLKECNARAITNRPKPGEAVIILKGIEQSPHEHPPNHNECAAKKVKRSLKRKAIEHPEQPPTQLLRSKLGGLSQGTV